MTKKKLIIFIGIFVFIIGGFFVMSQIGRVYIYDSDEEQIDVTSYLKTGQFYFHTDKQYPTIQSLVYKVPPDFMSRDMLLMVMNKDKRFSFIDSFSGFKDKEKAQKIITDIIRSNANFSKHMQYQSSYIADVTGNFANLFTGHFIYQDQQYTISVHIEYYSVSDLEKQKFAWFYIILKKGFTHVATPYEQMIEEAKQQPQPKVYNWW